MDVFKKLERDIFEVMATDSGKSMMEILKGLYVDIKFDEFTSEGTIDPMKIGHRLGHRDLIQRIYLMRDNYERKLKFEMQGNGENYERI